jgi:hypothetical protein
MKLLAILSLGLLLALPSVAFDQEPTITRQLKGKPDTDINAGVFVTTKSDCSVAPPPSIQLITPPAHGKVTVTLGQLRATDLKQCPATDLPAVFASYRSEPDYVGQDTFAIEIITAGGRKQIQQITVTLTKAGEGT